MKIAVVYDHINKIGGAERILSALHEMFPEAPFYTSVYDLGKASWAKDLNIIPSFLQKIPLAKGMHEIFPIVPIFAFEQFDFKNFDVVVSVTSAEAKGIITRPETLHICYLLTPTRYLWSQYYDYFRSTLFRKLSLPAVSLVRIWDQVAGQRPDVYLSISRNVSKRIEKYYHRKSEVLFPPVDTHIFKPRDGLNLGNFFLIVSRLVAYKHLEIAIEACNKLKLPLKIVGEGLERRSLQKIAGKTIEFLGVLTEEELIEYYQSCRAFISCQEEDFGISTVEALACGKPVISFKGGGALEIISEGKTGAFFYPQSSEALIKILRDFNYKSYKSEDCRVEAQKYSKPRFKKNFLNFIKEEWSRFKRLENL